MTRLSKLLVVTVLLVAVAAMTAASASAGLPRPERSKAVARGMIFRHANVGLPPVVGGPYGDPSDYPGLFGSSVQSDSTGDANQAGGGDDCLHQVILPRTSC
jgi:hypothetical protein